MRPENDSIGTSVPDVVGLTLLLTNHRLRVHNDGSVVVDMDLEHCFGRLPHGTEECRIEPVHGYFGVDSDVEETAAEFPGLEEADIVGMTVKLVAENREVVQKAVKMLEMDANDLCPREKPQLLVTRKDWVRHYCGDCLGIPSPSRIRTSWAMVVNCLWLYESAVRFRIVDQRRVQLGCLDLH